MRPGAWPLWRGLLIAILSRGCYGSCLLCLAWRLIHHPLIHTLNRTGVAVV